jgi:hypothetical protein
MGWNTQQAKSVAKALDRVVGDGWRYLTPEVRSALIAKAVLMVILGQVKDSVLVSDVQALLDDVTRELEGKM